ncbi:MAG: septum formation initiator family protein [Alphaproteobacteria bacterium]|nr:septum formation initiator family protein [Alphaproteobacteria bacterium]
MTLVREIRARGRHIATPVIAVTVLFYFAYHAIQGERGLVTRWHLSQQLSAADAQVTALKAEHDALQHKVRLLRPESLDRDLLDERAREMLGLIGQDEVVIRD